MGEATSNEHTSNHNFFFTLMARVRETFPVVYGGGGSRKPHSAEFRNFSETWGFQKIVFEMADEKIEKVAQVNQQYLSDFFLFLTYLIQKGEMEDQEDKFQENIRKSKRGGK